MPRLPPQLYAANPSSYATGNLGPGKATQGIDPRARRPAVSRGHTRRCRSGSTDISFTEVRIAPRWDLVRCDVPQRHTEVEPCLPSSQPQSGDAAICLL